MSTTPPNVLQLARQGDPDAIAALMNRHLEAQGITAHVLQQENRLRVSLESSHVPNQSDLVAYVKKGIIGLKLATIHHLTVSGQQVGAEAVAWSEDLRLQDAPAATPAAVDLGAIADSPQAEVDLDFDFDLDSTESDDIDLSDLDTPDLGEDFNQAISVDLDLADSDFGLDLTDARPDSTASEDFDLDLALTEGASDGGNELDFDLGGLDDTSPLDSAADLDLDLGFVDTPSPDADAELDFDLSGADDLDFDLNFEDQPSPDPAATDLDFDLGLTEASEAAGPGDASADLTDFDLNFDAADAPVDDGLDLDLGLPESMGDAGAASPELASGDDLDFDLNFDAEFDAEADAGASSPELASGDDLDFDLNFDAEFDAEADAGASSPELASGDDLDFDLNFDAEADAGASSPELDFDLADGSAADVGDFDVDLDLVDAPDVSAALEPMDAMAGDDLDLAQAAGLETDLDFDLGMDEPGLEELGTADAEFDLNFDADPNLVSADSLEFDGAATQASDLGDELNDLWDEDNAGVTFDPADSPIDAWAAEAEQPSIDDAMAVGADDEGTDAAFGLIDDQGTDTEGLNASDLDASDLDASDLDAAAVALELEAEVVDLTADVNALAVDATSSDLNMEAELAVAGLDTDLDALPEDGQELDLQESEDIVFADLGAATDLDQSGFDDLAINDWSAEPDLSSGEEVDLGAGEADDWPTDEIDPDFTAADLPDISFEPPLTDDLDGAVNLEDLSPALDEVIPEFDGGEEAAWEMPEEGFDPNLMLDTPGDFDAELAVDPAAPPNPFDDEMDFPADETRGSLPAIEAWEAESEVATPFAPADVDPSANFDAEADTPFVTMELDQTVEGDDLAIDSFSADSSQLDDDGVAFESAEVDFAAADSDLVAIDFADEAEDLAFESVELAADELNNPEFGAVRFSDDGLVADDAIESDFGGNVFDDGGFESDGFDTDGFSDSSGDAANGFMQDRNGAAFIDDEPDATDDFIQELASDPSTHVSLDPGQFSADGSIGRSERSGLPLWLLVGLGAVALALAGLLLNGLLGRLRQPTPGDAPVVTEPAPNPGTPPVDPATVPEVDLFRQAVNAAQTASNQAQTASTAADWQNVANSWASAIELMQRVPEADPNHAVAQQKAVDYQPNLSYARQNVERLQ
ncbi:hypothetical protein IQ254_23235 [Nodosilinea sp. LEGE 07088]|uniref:hypothetical protein n=1 Tax=Nodosilinea sp. LEGE 07088 TaxID=2777968 RepID=UPI0018800B16|nr:hypothetical protein [Nodosilinea sp. LEGE 07088]MBE9140074.1 hypothetical protein [Nodosilinea sp. LEGE 07088]